MHCSGRHARRRFYAALYLQKNNMIRITLFPLILAFAAALPAQGHNPLSIRVDEKAELLLTVQYLSDYFLVTEAELDYKKELEEAFGAYREHPAVNLFKSMSQRYFAFDKPIEFICHYSFPELEVVVPFEEDHIIYWNYRDTLDLFARELKDFYEASSFHAFFEANQPFYDSVAADVRTKLSGTDYVGHLEGYYRAGQASYNVIVSPLLHSGGFGPRTRRQDGSHDLYAFIGPSAKSGAFPQFNTNYLAFDLILHEFSHSFCNPVVNAHYAELEQFECLYEPIAEAMQKQGYGNWKTCLYEHLVRASVVRLVHHAFGQKYAEALRKVEVEEGSFAYLDGILAVLEAYEGREGAAFDSIAPGLLVYFEEQAGAVCE